MTIMREIVDQAIEILEGDNTFGLREQVTVTSSEIVPHHRDGWVDIHFTVSNNGDERFTARVPEDACVNVVRDMMDVAVNGW